MKTKTVIFSLMFLGLFLNCFAQPEFELRGPNRDGYYPDEKNLLKEWPESGPELLKSITNIGEGFTLPAVTEDRIYVTGMIDSTGYLFAYDIKGELIWKKAYGKEWTANFPGSRSTPTIDEGKIYFEDSFGHIFCYNEKGEIVWTVDTKKEFGFREIEWGANESFLIDGDKLICTPGGEEVMMAVINKNTGETIKTIKGNSQKSAHCTPVIVNHNNKRIILTMTAQALVAVDADKYEMLFEYPFFNQWGVNPNTPLYHEGNILISTVDAGSKLLKLKEAGNGVTEIWSNELFDNENEGAILHNGYVYMGTTKGKIWYCFNWLTGEQMHSNKLIGRSNAVFADGLLYTYNFRGYVSLINPVHEKFDLISQFKMTDGSKQHIVHPVIKNGKLYIRRGNALNIYNISNS